MLLTQRCSVWDRIGFKTDPDLDQAFQVNAGPDVDPDPEPGFDGQKII